MKHRFAAAVFGAFLLSLTAINAGAYDTYTREKCADDKLLAEQLREINQNIDAVLSEETFGTETSDYQEIVGEETDLSPLYSERIELSEKYRAELGAKSRELAGKLMDYDVMLKELRIIKKRYETEIGNYAELELKVKTGEASQKELSDSKDRSDELMLRIRSVLFDISELKSDIESVTGETLKDSFDFDGIYLITDALSIDTAKLTDGSQLASICAPKNASAEAYVPADVKKTYSSAVQAFYSLGETLRSYLKAASDLKNGEREYKLGQLTDNELEVLQNEKDDRFLDAARAKAEYSKSLLELDGVSGNALTIGYGVCEKEYETLRSTIDDMKKGVGLWLCYQSENGIVFFPAYLPNGVSKNGGNDKAVYNYTVEYCGAEIGGASTGTPCTLKQTEYISKENYAYVTFYKNGMEAKRYRIDVFAPYGGFIG